MVHSNACKLSIQASKRRPACMYIGNHGKVQDCIIVYLLDICYFKKHIHMAIFCTSASIFKYLTLTTSKEE